MKGWMRLLLLFGAILCFSIGALAADSASTQPGIYDLTAEAGWTERLTCTPQLAGGSAADESNPTFLGKSYTFYAGAERLSVAVSDAADENYTVVLAREEPSAGAYVPTVNSIYYMKTAAAKDNAVSFQIYPKSMDLGYTYYLYLSGSDQPMTKIASFHYGIPHLPGDVDLDGDWTGSDALLALRIATYPELDWSPIQRLAAEVTDDHRVTSDDVLEILKASVGKRIFE